MFSKLELPKARDLQKLPIRGIVAYAANTSQRLSCELRGIIADHLIDELLSQIKAVCSECFIADLDSPSIISIAGEIAGAMSHVTKSSEQSIIASCLRQTALVASAAIEAASNPELAERWRVYAAERAEAAVSAIAVLNDQVAADSAIRDYERFVREYWEQPEDIIGNPIESF